MTVVCWLRGPMRFLLFNIFQSLCTKARLRKCGAQASRLNRLHKGKQVYYGRQKHYQQIGFIA